MKTKQCSACRSTLSLDAFYIRKANSDGLEGQCKMCRKAKRVANAKARKPALHLHKECTSCRISKPMSEFYKHINMADGRLNKCMSCVDEYSKIRADKPEVRKRENSRSVKRNKTAERKKYMRDYMRSYSKANPQKIKARSKVLNALRSGAIVKPEHCKECGLQRDTQGHHHDYSQPLNVRWLCQECHDDLHLDRSVQFSLFGLTEVKEAL